MSVDAVANRSVDNVTSGSASSTSDPHHAIFDDDVVYDLYLSFERTVNNQKTLILTEHIWATQEELSNLEKYISIQWVGKSFQCFYLPEFRTKGSTLERYMIYYQCHIQLSRCLYHSVMLHYNFAEDKNERRIDYGLDYIHFNIQDIYGKYQRIHQIIDDTQSLSIHEKIKFIKKELRDIESINHLIEFQALNVDSSFILGPPEKFDVCIAFANRVVNSFIESVLSLYDYAYQLRCFKLYPPDYLYPSALAVSKDKDYIDKLFSLRHLLNPIKRCNIGDVNGAAAIHFDVDAWSDYKKNYKGHLEKIEKDFRENHPQIHFPTNVLDENFDELVEHFKTISKIIYHLCDPKSGIKNPEFQKMYKYLLCSMLRFIKCGLTNINKLVTENHPELRNLEALKIRPYLVLVDEETYFTMSETLRKI